MNYIKRIIAVCLTAVMLIGTLAGCGNIKKLEEAIRNKNKPEINVDVGNEKVDKDIPDDGEINKPVDSKDYNGKMVDGIRTFKTQYVDDSKAPEFKIESEAFVEGKIKDYYSDREVKLPIPVEEFEGDNYTCSGYFSPEEITDSVIATLSSNSLDEDFNVMEMVQIEITLEVLDDENTVDSELEEFLEMTKKEYKNILKDYKGISVRCDNTYIGGTSSSRLVEYERDTMSGSGKDSIRVLNIMRVINDTTYLKYRITSMNPLIDQEYKEVMGKEENYKLWFMVLETYGIKDMFFNTVGQSTTYVDSDNKLITDGFAFDGNLDEIDYKGKGEKPSITIGNGESITTDDGLIIMVPETGDGNGPTGTITITTDKPKPQTEKSNLKFEYDKVLKEYTMITEQGTKYEKSFTVPVAQDGATENQIKVIYGENCDGTENKDDVTFCLTKETGGSVQEVVTAKITLTSIKSDITDHDEWIKENNDSVEKAVFSQFALSSDYKIVDNISNSGSNNSMETLGLLVGKEDKKIGLKVYVYTEEVAPDTVLAIIVMGNYQVVNDSLEVDMGESLSNKDSADAFNYILGAFGLEQP